jgi:hypothetical protein
MVVIVQQDARESLHFMAVLFINTVASSFVARIKAVAQTTNYVVMLTPAEFSCSV